MIDNHSTENKENIISFSEVNKRITEKFEINLLKLSKEAKIILDIMILVDPTPIKKQFLIDVFRINAPNAIESLIIKHIDELKSLSLSEKI